MSYIAEIGIINKVSFLTELAMIKQIHLESLIEKLSCFRNYFPYFFRVLYIMYADTDIPISSIRLMRLLDQYLLMMCSVRKADSRMNIDFEYSLDLAASRLFLGSFFSNFFISLVDSLNSVTVDMSRMM